MLKKYLKLLILVCNLSKIHLSFTSDCPITNNSTLNFWVHQAANCSVNCCLPLAVAATSTPICKTGEFCHQRCVYNFNSDNFFDKTCAKTSGILAASSCIECTIYHQFPNCLPFLMLFLAHNGLKIGEKTLTCSFSEPYNQQSNTKTIDEMR